MIILILMSLISFIGVGIHLMYSPLFGWDEDLTKLKKDNRLAALTMNNLITYFLAFFGVVDLLWAFNVVQIQIILLVGIIGFWIIRAILQISYYNMSDRLSQFFLTIYILMTIGHISIIL